MPLESEPTLEEQLQTGISRLRADRGTWKVPPAGLPNAAGWPTAMEPVLSAACVMKLSTLPQVRCSIAC